MDGRASFPERVGSFAVPTYESLGYVEVVGVDTLGAKGMIGGFGNRLGTISLERCDEKKVIGRSSMDGVVLRVVRYRSWVLRKEKEERRESERERERQRGRSGAYS